MENSRKQDRGMALSQPSGLLYFWGERVLYIGPGLPATLHAHHATQVCIPLSGTIRLRPGPPAPWQEYSGALIPADQPHDSDVAVDLLATFWLRPGVADARKRMPCTTSQRIIPLERQPLADLLPKFLACWSQRWAPDRADSLLSETLRALSRRRPFDTRLDSRVVRIMEIVGSGRLGSPWLPELAASVALSPSRLEHLFRSEVGISLRRYLLWQRLQWAVRELASGSSVTRAAHSAGFSDTAHLSRTFRRMLGFTPSSALELQVSRFVQAHGETPG